MRSILVAAMASLFLYPVATVSIANADTWTEFAYLEVHPQCASELNLVD